MVTSLIFESIGVRSRVVDCAEIFNKNTPCKILFVKFFDWFLRDEFGLVITKIIVGSCLLRGMYFSILL